MTHDRDLTDSTSARSSRWLFSQGTTTRLLMACAMGGVVGLEREWRHKASGLRTNMLICMGAALFTMLSAVLAGDSSPNKGQVASNIVQGIGFLGAGLILHTRNRVLGLTSAATVWVVAAIGMACGAGLYVEAAIATGIVLFALRFIGLLEARSRWKRFPMLYEVRGSDEKTMFARYPEGAGPRASAAEYRRARQGGRAGAGDVYDLGEQRTA